MSTPPLRSLLFVPADSEKKLAKAAGTGADALILDLEDSVAPERKGVARELAASFLGARPASLASEVWVRINPLDGDAIADLAAIVRARPDGIMVPKPDGPADLV